MKNFLFLFILTNFSFLSAELIFLIMKVKV